MTSIARKTLIAVLVLFVAMLVILGGVLVLYLPAFTEKDTRPYCPLQLNQALIIWMDDHETTMYPNVNGSSKESLHTIVDQMNTTRHEAIYSYVPGLKGDDPKELILLYSKQPTRFTWHGDLPTLFRPRRWVVVPVDFYWPDSRPHRGESSDWVTTAELKSRLRKTLDFLKAEQRTNWQQVVQEHTAFLERLSD